MAMHPTGVPPAYANPKSNVYYLCLVCFDCISSGVFRYLVILALALAFSLRLTAATVLLKVDFAPSLVCRHSWCAIGGVAA